VSGGGGGGDTAPTDARARADPGPLGMQYMADLVSLLYLRALVAAVDDLLAHPARAAAEKRYPREPEPVLKFPDVVTDMAKPSLSPIMRTLVTLEEAPGCLQLEQMTFGRAQVVLSDDPGDVLNPYASRVRKLGSSPSAWSRFVEGPNWNLVPREFRSRKDCVAPDKCSYFVEPADGSDTPLVFRLPKMEVGLVVVCGFGKDGGKALIDEAVAVEFDGEPLPVAGYSLFPDPKCAAVQSAWSGTVRNAHGHLYLAIMPKAGVKLKVSEVITA